MTMENLLILKNSMQQSSKWQFGWLVLGLLLFLSFIVIRPFIEIVVLSVVLAVALYPFFGLVAKWLGGRRRLSAAVITILLLLIVFGPATWLGLDLVEALRTTYERIESGAVSAPSPPATVKTWPFIGEPLFEFWEQASTNLKAALAKIAPYLKPLGSSLLGASGSAGIGVLQFFASVIIAGFLLSPGPSLVEAVATFLRRLVSKRGDEFLQLAGATIRNVSQGVIGVSLLQALLAGIGLLAAGVPAAESDRVLCSHSGNCSNWSRSDFDPRHDLELDNDGDNNGADPYSLLSASRPDR